MSDKKFNQEQQIVEYLTVNSKKISDHAIEDLTIDYCDLVVQLQMFSKVLDYNIPEETKIIGKICRLKKRLMRKIRKILLKPLTKQIIEFQEKNCELLDQLIHILNDQQRIIREYQNINQ
ncbi:MAG: hypothetical protein RR746_08310 [Lachnospiraceae bacterium]